MPAESVYTNVEVNCSSSTAVVLMVVAVEEIARGANPGLDTLLTLLLDEVVELLVFNGEIVVNSEQLEFEHSSP